MYSSAFQKRVRVIPRRKWHDTLHRWTNRNP